MTKSGPSLANNKTTILLVDDHAMFREGLAGFLAKQPDPEVCGDEAGAPEAIQLVLQEKPDFVKLWRQGETTSRLNATWTTLPNWCATPCSGSWNRHKRRNVPSE